jgi:hypothetical protein
MVWKSAVQVMFWIGRRCTVRLNTTIRGNGDELVMRVEVQSLADVIGLQIIIQS